MFTAPERESRTRRSKLYLRFSRRRIDTGRRVYAAISQLA